MRTLELASVEELLNELAKREDSYVLSRLYRDKTGKLEVKTNYRLAADYSYIDLVRACLMSTNRIENDCLLSRGGESEND